MRRLRVAVAAVVLLGGAACGGDDQDEVGLALTRPDREVSVEGNIIDLDVSPSNIEIVKADGNRTGRSGHFHVFIDSDPVEPGEAISVAPHIIHTTDDPIRVSGLSRGEHELTVVLGDGAHRRIGSLAVTTRVTVRGPAVTATAPGHVPTGQAVPLELALDGVTPVPADGDTSGATGHFHVFVDKEPVSPGDVVPTGDPKIVHTAATSVSVPGLEAGEHDLWVVVGDGTHRVLDPPVMARVKVIVS